ncbi:A/G-specific adenine glycosylase [Sphaceloma murrayae]|uniref:Adenine DNA glycosylase n=1 Tax=Sphaceloma murrayae TaxID=2082308 RepID=A0A2K1R0P7_9PEZI|nr:A/G-specific adenine glycosylase [Sphaceloma murrayae]
MVKRVASSAPKSIKRRKVSTATPIDKPDGLRSPKSTSSKATAIPPLRRHARDYHHPLFLSHANSSERLLQWFDSTSTARNMPWRKPFPAATSLPEDPDEVQELLSRRAYEVWVSEIMLQQTRVSTVIPYFNNWIEKWPTVQALAEASQDDVLAAWKGLGYYSRATRLWKGAKMVVDELAGRLPGDVEGLLKVSGIGPYTAGAVASIAFGRAVPLVDGNVARVLSRQIGLFADMKKREVDTMIWETARALVRDASTKQHSEHESAMESGQSTVLDMSDIPGRWNQALMELGSTICTPRPRCGDCPIQDTCRTFAEGALVAEKLAAAHEAPNVDIEDACNLCDPLEPETVEAASLGMPAADAQTAEDKENVGKAARTTVKGIKSLHQKGPRQRSLQDFAFKGPAKVEQATSKTEARQPLNEITAYCSLFPKRAIKKQVPEEDCAVCVIEYKSRTGPSRFLIEQRPDTGLLASMWQLPSFTIVGGGAEEDVREQMSSLTAGVVHGQEVEYLGPLGKHAHVFSHLKLNMHVHYLRVDGGDAPPGAKQTSRQKWVDWKGVEDATMGTGMRKCWAMLKR